MAWTKENQREYMKAYRVANKDKIAAYGKAWQQANKEKQAAYPRDSVKAAARLSEWKARNKGKVNADTAKRRAAKLERTPPWADMAAIKKVYEAAQFIHEELGYDLPHVDHIIPLQGKNVSGLHIASNLQLLSAFANTSKGNSYE